MTTLLPSKRKRAAINYKEVEEDFDWEQDIQDVAAGGEEGYDDGESSDDDDGEYGSRKKPGKKKQSKKRAITRNPPAKRDEKPFRFLDLPQELRDEIYQHALFGNNRVYLGSRMKGGYRIVARQEPAAAFIDNSLGKTFADEPRQSLSPRLLAVNKQIHSEAVEYLYRQRIVVADTTALHTFLATIGQSNRLLIADMAINGWCLGRRSMMKAMNEASMTLLSTCVNLRKLQFRMPMDAWYSVNSAARQIYRDGHYFLEAYARAHGGVEAAVNIVDFKNWTDSSHRWKDAIQFGVGEDATAARSRACKKEFQETLRALLKKGQVIPHD